MNPLPDFSLLLSQEVVGRNIGSVCFYQLFIFKAQMDDYDFHKDSLKPNRIYADSKPTKNNRQKAASVRSKSKEKMIITSFSKKQLAEINGSKSPLSNAALNNKKLASVESPKKSQCQSQYYIKTAETKTEMDLGQLQDEIKIKDGQLEVITLKLAKAEQLIHQLQAQNRLKTERISTLEKEMNTILARSLKSLENQHFGADLAYECDKAKQDSKRLLRMLQKTAEYEYFSKFALMDDGIQFLLNPNQLKKSSLDASLAKKPLHFCTCNKDYISESTFWVPEKFYNFGKEFITERKGEFTKSEYQLLLYELNRLWRQRQKKIINTLNGQKARQIEKYKRRQANFHSLQKNSLNR